MYIQSPEELDLTRKKVFSEINDSFWKDILDIGIKPKKILEVGCGGGILSRKLAMFFPESLIYGVDFDSGHIEYAKDKASSLGLDNCIYEVADAHNLPFENEEFEICISHTVMNFCEPHRFLFEQKRVLKANGLIVVCLAKFKRCINPNIWLPESGAEYDLLQKLQTAAEDSGKTNVISYHTSEKECLTYLFEEGFSEINMKFLPNIIYFPDGCDKSFDEGLAEIKDSFHQEKLHIEKMLRIAPCALSDQEVTDLLTMMNERQNRRINDYVESIKQWDFSVSFTFVATAKK